MDAGALIGIIIGSLGLIAVVASAAVIVRSSILKTTNDVLTIALNTERVERKETEARCREDLAELRGNVTTLTRDHAVTVAHEVIRVFREEGVLPNG